jgi:hypothetical protein
MLYTHVFERGQGVHKPVEGRCGPKRPREIPEMNWRTLGKALHGGKLRLPLGIGA